MRRFLLALGFIFSACFCRAQGIAPIIQWQNTIGGSADDNLVSIKQTIDGGYILGGSSNSNSSGDKSEDTIGYYDYWVVKLNANGNIQWQNTIGGNNADVLKTVEQTTDGGYIIGGYSLSNISGDKTENCIGNFDYWIVKLNSAGNILWQNTIGGSLTDYMNCLKQTNDGGYILGGVSNSNISGDKTENRIGDVDFWIIKLDAIGNIQWQNTIGGNSMDEAITISQTFDGGYIVGGGSQSGISGDKTETGLGNTDYWIVKLDGSGNIQWQNTIGGNDWDYLYSIDQTSDGGYILGGTSRSNISGDKTENNIAGGGWFDDDYWVLKLNANGNIIWQNTIGGSYSDILYTVSQTLDGGYILNGMSGSDISGDKIENAIDNSWDYWIVKINATGSLIWQNSIGTSAYDQLFNDNIRQTNDGGFIIGGYTDANISGDKTENSMGGLDYWIIKLTPECTGCQIPTTPFTTVLTHTKAKLNWTTEPCALGYKIRIRQVGTTAWSNITIPANIGFKTINSFIPNTSYEWQVRSICLVSPLVQSQFTSLQTFTTPLKLEGDGVVDSQATYISEMLIFPNPIENQLTVYSKQLALTSIEIIDVLGRKVFAETMNQKSVIINLKSLSSGIYFIKVQMQDGEIQVKKIVKP